MADVPDESAGWVWKTDVRNDVDTQDQRAKTKGVGKVLVHHRDHRVPEDCHAKGEEDDDRETHHLEAGPAVHAP